ncbi:hypothetical protein SAMD00020551_1024 [Mesobacillus selenatarsenatis SF-1]|uniref:Uncharacterized protein n=1 Tax=Mesobacillus selenatarsenatis (strain DSM 18680 / JCM 14380 / FERM P-15431 / SF-1) TaxID=1321606 RepID=A0A0A8X114_MESS1|nr:hypothetical protein SAMD00020551_1024 [Mesobacillus selenatarsenatis SF-1]
MDNSRMMKNKIKAFPANGHNSVSFAMQNAKKGTQKSHFHAPYQCAIYSVILMIKQKKN